MNSENEVIKQWRRHCETVQMQTQVTIEETTAQKEARIANLLKDYNAFVEYYFRHYCSDRKTGKVIQCAPFHVAAANRIKKSNNLKAVFMWARGHAKSTHLDIMIPLWLKCQKEKIINVMVLVGKSQENANTLLSDIQAELEFNQRYISDFGVQKCEGSWTTGEFVTADGTAFFARGRGQSPRGLRYRSHRPDYIVIDDLDDDELTNNPERVSKLTDWVKEALFGVLDGGRGRFIMVGNLIGKHSVLANIAATKGVYTNRVNAVDNEGKPAWSSKWAIEELREMEQFMGYRAWNKEMMNNPIMEGAVFRFNWIKWKRMLPLKEYAELIAYCDPSFKATTKNDYKAVKLWGKTKSGELHHIDAFVRQCSVSEMVRWFYDLHEKIQKAGAVCGYYIEANFLQDIILDEFTREGKLRGYQLPIRADRRKKPDKFQRIESISPLWERGFVFYNEAKQKDPDMTTGIDQTLSFEKGMSGHDDAPDADEGAIYLLQGHCRLQSFAPLLGKRSSPKNIW